MSAPNVTSPIHASLQSDDQGVILSAVNIVSVVRNGPGDYTVTMGSPIDQTQRIIVGNTIEDSASGLSIDRGADTDTVFDVLTTNAAGVAEDASFNLAVIRMSQPA